MTVKKDRDGPLKGGSREEGLRCDSQARGKGMLRGYQGEKPV